MDRRWYVAGTVAVKLSTVVVMTAGEVVVALGSSLHREERAPSRGEIAVGSGGAASPVIVPARRPR